MSTSLDNTATPRSVVGYTPIPVCALEGSSVFSFDLYQADTSISPTLFRGKDRPITPADMVTLQKQGIQFLYIRNNDRSPSGDSLLQQLDPILQNDLVSAVDRLQLLQLAAITQVDTLFQMLQLDAIIPAVDALGRQIAAFLQTNPIPAAEVFRLARGSGEMFAHPVNVAFYCVLMMRQFQAIGDEPGRAAVGALLHDFGKRRIARRLATNPHDLTPAERNILNAHPQAGYEELCERPELDFGQLMMIYQHHERPDGGGYPVGVTNEDIHPWARICATADTFDNLTGKRLHRRLIDLPTAMEQMNTTATAWIGRWFDVGTNFCARASRTGLAPAWNDRSVAGGRRTLPRPARRLGFTVDRPSTTSALRIPRSRHPASPRRIPRRLHQEPLAIRTHARPARAALSVRERAGLASHGRPLHFDRATLPTHPCPVF